MARMLRRSKAMAAGMGALVVLGLAGGSGAVRGQEVPVGADDAPAVPQAGQPVQRLELPQWIRTEDLKQLQAGEPVEVPGIGTINSLEELLGLFLPADAKVSRGRLVDIQGKPLQAAEGAPIAARVTSLCRGGACDPTRQGSLADPKGTFMVVPPADYEPGRMIGVLVQLPSGLSFEAQYMPVEHQTVDVYLPTHLQPQAAAPREVNRDEVAGVVVDEQGRALAGVTVELFEGLLPGANAVTDDAGQFRIGLGKFGIGEADAENVLVRFSKPGYATVRFLNQQAGMPGWVVALSSKTFVEGVVRGPDGKPAPKAVIRANQGPKQTGGGMVEELWSETTADETGRYRLYLQPDEYELVVTAPGGAARLPRQPIAHGETRALDVALQAGVTFQAKVVDAETGEPVAGVRLWHWQHPGIEGRSGDDGRLTIEGLAPGEFSFSVEANGYMRWWSEEASREWSRKSIDNPRLKWQRNFDSLDFDLQPEMAVVTIAVERGVRVRGRVVDPDGQPVGGATVAPALTGTGNSLTGDTRFSVQTGADGTFEVLLPASHRAKYNLVAHDGAYEEWRRWANGVSQPLTTTPGQEIEGLELQLTRPAIVRGRVLDAEGQPAANQLVRAGATDKLDNRYYEPPQVTTDADGRFELRYLRPGAYHIYADAPGQRAFHAEKPLSVEAAQEVDGVEIRLAARPVR